MKKFLLFGLGNPGGDFSHTRHNLGADMVGKWIEYMRVKSASVSNWKTHEKFHTRVCDVVYGDYFVTILSPLVFMNESGKVVDAYLRYNPLERDQIIVVRDDLELPLGDTKFQSSGSAHGHNGVRSIHEYLGDTNIPQFRIGIGRPSDTTPIEKFVLETFTPEEKKILEEKQKSILEKITNIAFPSPVLGEG